MEKFVENLIYSARWIMAPIYLGLSLALMALANQPVMPLAQLYTYVPPGCH